MASALMAWVWFGLTLAQLNNAESHRYAHRHLTGQDEQEFVAAPQDWTDRSFSAPVWNFLQGSKESPEMSDFNQPQYRCSNGTLSLRFSLIRYSNVRLEDGGRLLTLPDRCHSSVHIYKWWLLVKLHSDCQMAKQTADEMVFGQLKLHYFNRLLQKNMTGTAVCENPVQTALPLVTCRTSDVIVQLPRETKLRRVKELVLRTNEGYSVRQRRTPSTLFVEISKLPGRDSGFELVYIDSTGTLRTAFAACSPLLPQRLGRHRVRRSLEEEDIYELWGFDEPSLGLFNPQTTQMTQTTQATTQTTGSSKIDLDTAIIEETVYGEGIYELWGFPEIPEGPYTGDVEIPGTSASTTPATPCTTTAPPVPTTTVTPATTTTVPTTTMTTTTTTTTTTTAAPTTTPTTTTTPASTASVTMTTTTTNFGPSTTSRSTMTSTMTSTGSTTSSSAPFSTT